MIRDIMEIGGSGSITMEPTNPESLVESVLNETFRIQPDTDISFSYTFTHQRKISVDTLKVARVFSNIVGNALQAMKGQGPMWFRTRELDEGLLEFTIGNGGSFVGLEHRSKLFDAFFTSGKKGGTGLGLAIAKKIVEDHGGTIRCDSWKDGAYPEGAVEFCFTLPLASECVEERPIPLPSNSREIYAAAERLRSQTGSGRETALEEADLEVEILGLLARNQEAFSLLMVDDEVIYHNGLASLLGENSGIASRIRLHTTTNLSGAVELAGSTGPLFVIMDVDLGSGAPDGIEATRALRQAGYQGQICIHSNRFVFDDGRIALDAGASVVLPKPLSRAHLLKLLRAALEARLGPVERIEAPQGSKGEGTAALASERLRVAVLDDSRGTLIAWKSKLGKDADVQTFRTSGDFWKAVGTSQEQLGSLDVVVSDYNLAPEDPADGGTFASELRERGFKGIILLCSGAIGLAPEVSVLFDGFLPKGTLSAAELRDAVASARRSKQNS
jgi:CheY-like chemotaxis protein